MKPIIEVRNVWKSYKIGGKKENYLSLRDSLMGFGKNLLGQKKETFWALQDVSFDVMPGECIGIIGRNGAGKSTLLKILSQITPPTKGHIKMRGRVASLLEVGTGFHPELTGRENIYLNGSILGMRRTEINQVFDEIVDFSGVEKFLDTPLKHYSSGMRLRLAFAVAAHLNPEILLIDEVLAVGDAEFQKKCLGKMDEVSKSGRTVVFVSHNMGAVKRICSRGMLVTEGKSSKMDNINLILDKYLHSPISSIPKFEGPLSSCISLTNLFINNKSVFQNILFVSQLHSISIKVHFTVIKHIETLRITLSIFNEIGRIFSLHDVSPTPCKKGKIISHYEIPSHLLRPGIYRIGIGGLINDENSDWFWNGNISTFRVSSEWDSSIEAINHGTINVNAKTYRETL